MLGAGGFDLGLLDLERLLAQRCGAGIGQHPAAAATAKGIIAMGLHLVQVHAQLFQDDAWCPFQPAAADLLAGIVKGDAVAHRIAFQRPVLDRIGDHLDDVAHLHVIDGRAIPAGRIPARRPPGMAAFRDDQRCGADLACLVDQPHGQLALKFDIAGQIAEIGGLEGLGTIGPVQTEVIEHPRHGCHAQRVVLQLLGGGGQQHIGVRLVDRHRHAVFPGHAVDGVAELIRGSIGAELFFGLRHDMGEPGGQQPGGIHAVTRLFHQIGDIDAHRANQGAAPAHGATVVDQFFPVFQLADG